MNLARAAALLAATLAACGPGVSAPPPVQVRVQPDPADVRVAGSQRFLATVTGASDGAVTWEVRAADGGAVDPAVGGSVDAEGLYTAPAAPGQFLVVATSAADPGRSAAARVSVVLPTSTDAVGLLPLERRTTWDPGLNAVGGIPHRTAIFRTLSPGGGDDTRAIQEALDACPPEQVVQLAAGTFHLSGHGLEITRSGVTLRGAGPDRTRLEKVAGTSYPVVILGVRWVKYTQPTDLADDAVKGARTVTLAGDLDPPLAPGELVTVDEVTDPALSVWSERSPPGDPSRGWMSRYDRPLGQVLEVAAVDGRTVTFTTPFHLGFQVAHQAQLVRFSRATDGPPTPMVRWAGLEDLYVSGGEGGDGGGNIHLFATAYSWVVNVESDRSDGGSVNLDATFRSVLRDSYLHSTVNPTPGGGGYGISINSHAADNLVENNISWNFNKVMVMRATGGGNVVAYNYLEDGWMADFPTIPEVGLNAAHMTTPHLELFEGNQAFNFGSDSVWGNSIYITAFRNHLTGKRRSVAPLHLTDEVTRRVVGMTRWHWWYSFVGNVLGTADQDPAPNHAFTYEGCQNDPVPMWCFEDEAVKATTLRHGNFDYFTGTTAWDPGIARRELPSSLYLSVKPTFFGDAPWPLVTPEREAPLAAGTLPARARFDALHGL